uniref:preprotein translocase subunit SecA n=1 Tax=Timspurckia oligopyrenoides TaxID=708627 RepID=UPI001FCD834F|nr:preprotein translocase subunit SecA [Timspurckia oligopyrenoides]UNJ17594.1 preprotein translocase subunit SecA [Timspurckia oligopyrenoides]
MFNLVFNVSERELMSCRRLVKKINALEVQYEQMSDTTLSNKTKDFYVQLNNGKNLDEILVEAFATAKEVVKRLLQIKLFDVQLIGGIILHKGKISEMKTGEGKTLSAVLPAYLNALTRKGVHIVTVNDYLANRDYEQLAPIYNFLGLTVGLIQENMDSKTRKKNYASDITYVTNSQLGFDYLRENMATSQQQLILRSFNYAIIDEIDSILIDEARTPLIISGPGNTPSDRYIKADMIAKKLEEGKDYEINNKTQNITLTDKGIRSCETILKVNDLYNLENPWASFILNAIKANVFYIKNRSYIVKDNEVTIVDDNTGRIMNGRRWSDGMHQAIEAKEGVEIQANSRTLASITYQNFFLMYAKLSGMTGTAKTEEIEFEKIYSLNVVVIPTNKPMIRKDYPDLVYKSQMAKWKAIANECYDMHGIGRPVLVGTTSVANSELLSSLLKEYSIPHNLLNAKPENTIREAEIIAQAGRKSVITIATNMAGRGTDIILGGSPEYIAKTIVSRILSKNNVTENIFTQVLNSLGIHEATIDFRKQIFSLISMIYNNKEDISKEKISKIIQNLGKSSDITKELESAIYLAITDYVTKYSEREKQFVQGVGGLYVIGTERHPSRRIDNQLRGRSGRQGDPGESRFFLSLDDTLFQRFPIERLRTILDTLQLDDETPIQSPILMRTLEASQKKIESYYFDQRKTIFEYDQILNTHRQTIYKERRLVLQAKSLKLCILQYGDSIIKDLIGKYILNRKSKNINSFLYYLKNLLGLEIQLSEDEVESIPLDILYLYFRRQFRLTYAMKQVYVECLMPGAALELERFYFLSYIDDTWTKHLQQMASLMEGVGWRVYGQEDPLIEYKYDSFRLFIMMTVNIRQLVVYAIFVSNLTTR